MAKFSIKDVLFLASDKGITELRLEISLYPDYSNPFVSKIVDKLDIRSIETEMRYAGKTRNGKPVYWNGDTEIFVRVRMKMGESLNEWFETSWEPNPKDFNNNPMQPTNPLDREKLENNDYDDYYRHSPLAIKPFQ